MSARNLLLNALAQSNVDMNHFQLLNLDTSNLSISGLPPDVTPPAHNFLNSWIRGTQTWGYAQPAFTDLSGNLSTAQQQAITHLGTVTEGTWHGSAIAATYLPSLNGITAPSASVNMNNKTIQNLANPVNALDAVNLQTLNALAIGLNIHAAVAAATTGDSQLLGLNPVDGYTPVAGDRILVKNQATNRHWENGVYIAAAGAWTRATDMDSAAEFVAAYALVLNGSTNGNTAWVQITPSPVNIVNPDNGTEPLFVLYENFSTINAGPGLQKNGNTISAVGTTNRIAIGSGIDIDPNYVGQTSITTLGSITKGTWLAGIIGPAYGGTGAFNPGPISLGGAFSTEGAFSLKLVLSGNTVLNLPTTGNVVTEDGVQALTNKSIDTSEIVSGVFPLMRGGTGATNAVDARTILLPSQIGQGGKTLKTNGIDVFWG